MTAVLRAVLEQAPTLDRLAVTVTADRAADMVDDAEAGASDDRGVVHVVGQAFGELVALPHTPCSQSESPPYPPPT